MTLHKSSDAPIEVCAEVGGHWKVLAEAMLMMDGYASDANTLSGMITSIQSLGSSKEKGLLMQAIMAVFIEFGNKAGYLMACDNNVLATIPDIVESKVIAPTEKLKTAILEMSNNSRDSDLLQSVSLLSGVATAVSMKLVENVGDTVFFAKPSNDIN